MLLVATACGEGGGGERAASTPSTGAPAATETSAAPTSAAPAPDPGCALGDVPAAGEVTYVTGDGRLMGVRPDGTGARCLASDVAARFPGLSWSPDGTRVLLGAAQARAPEGPVTTAFAAGDQVGWSRPTGRAALAVTAAGRLVKRTGGTGPPEDVTFLERHESALYHPAGRAIVSVGTDRDGGYGLYLADNRGQLIAPLARGESARRIGPIGWTVSGALAFAAEHDDRWELHRLELGGEELTTVATTDSGDERIVGLAASTFAGGGLAWREDDCTVGPSATRVNRGGRSLTLPAGVDSALPVGWLPDGTLVLADRPAACAAPTGPADLLALRDGRVTKLASGAYDAAVRVVLPPGPDLPAAIRSTAPA